MEKIKFICKNELCRHEFTATKEQAVEREHSGYHYKAIICPKCNREHLLVDVITEKGKPEIKKKDLKNKIDSLEKENKEIKIALEKITQALVSISAHIEYSECGYLLIDRRGNEDVVELIGHLRESLKIEDVFEIKETKF